MRFAERARWNIRPALSDHSGLSPANFTTLAHFSVSSAMNFPKSAGEPGNVVPPRSARRALNLGSVRAALISLLSLSMISAGFFRHADAVPRTRLVARHEIAHGRDVRQHRRARCRRHCQRPQLASPGVFNGRGHDVETDLYLIG